ncbi:MAG: DUF1552 domain-containing protein [Fuerstiella sp.]|nr:DUF1552 domain-containing protein [Fuerstiella sp.]MCP4510537.1 DUF1552 domain-containing protein [Fuerstiella sp.]
MFGKWHISRRTTLCGAGAAVSLPLLDVMAGASSAAADRTSSPTRVAYLYIPNGVAEGAWQPEHVDDQGQLVRLNRWMSSLNPFRTDLTIFRNMWTPRGNGHIAGTATWLTGGGFDGGKLDAGGASVDQIAARYLQGQTLLTSLELSTRGEGIFSSSLPRNTVSWVDSVTPAPRDIEPRVVFDRMFRSGSSGSGNRSVIDLVLQDAKRLQQRVSTQDRKKIDEYLDSVRAIERRIEFAEQQQTRARQTPGLKQALRRPEPGIPEDHGQYMRTMMDLIVLAFWADATRVCTYMMDHGQSNRYFNFIDGVTGTWHALSHWKDVSGKTEDDDGITSWSSRDEKREMYNRVTSWHTEHVAYLLKKLRDIQELDGRLLDHSMIVYGSSLSDGHEHEAKNLPLLLAGGAAAAIRSGRLVGGRREKSMSDLHLAVLQRLGVPHQEFADSQAPLDLS